MRLLLLLGGLLISHSVLPSNALPETPRFKWEDYSQPGFMATRQRQFAATELALTNQLQKMLADPDSTEEAIGLYLKRLVPVCIYGNKLDQARSYCELALKLGQRQGKQKVTEAGLHATMAKVLARQQKYTQAELEYNTAIKLLEANKEKEKAVESLAGVQLGLAEVLTKQERFAEAEAIYRRILNGGEVGAKLNSEALDAHCSPAEFVGFAECLAGQQKFSDAEALLRRALKMDLDELGEGQPALAADYNDLAYVLSQETQLPQAEDCMSKALNICRKFHYTDLADWIDNMAVVLRDNNKIEESLKLQQEAAVMRNRMPEVSAKKSEPAL